MKEWKKKKQLNEKLKLDISEFEGMSLGSRVFAIKKLMIIALQRRGFKASSWHQIDLDNNSYTTSRISQETIPVNEWPNYIVTIKGQNEALKLVSVQSYDSITKSELKKLVEGLFMRRIYYSNYRGILGKYLKVNTIICNHFVLSLKPISIRPLA